MDIFLGGLCSPFWIVTLHGRFQCVSLLHRDSNTESLSVLRTTDKKPLSIFGIVHQFQKNTIRQAYSNKYGGIDSDLKKPFPRFMMDNYVDADILKLPEPAVVSRSPNQNRSFFPLTSNVRSEPSHAARSVTSSAQGDSPV